MPADEEDPIEILIDDMPDLHSLRPREMAVLLVDYLKVCHARGIYQVRVIHGQGTGTLKRCILALLSGM